MGERRWAAQGLECQGLSLGRVEQVGGVGKQSMQTHRAHVCVCARALASLCAFASPGVSGPGISNFWVDIWLRKFEVGELEICVGDGGGSVAISLWLQKRW